jgi:hypothetical protein
MAARELFVWYRVRKDRADAARAAALAMQRSLCAERPGLQARLLVRDDGETSTWMETYSLPSPPAGSGVDVAIEAAIAAAALRLEGLIDGPRHVEAFAVVA